MSRCNIYWISTFIFAVSYKLSTYLSTLAQTPVP